MKLRRMCGKVVGSSHVGPGQQPWAKGPSWACGDGASLSPVFCLLPPSPCLRPGHSGLSGSQSVSGRNLLIYTVASKSTKGGLIALWLITAAQWLTSLLLSSLDPGDKAGGGAPWLVDRKPCETTSLHVLKLSRDQLATCS